MEGEGKRIWTWNWQGQAEDVDGIRELSGWEDDMAGKNVPKFYNRYKHTVYSHSQWRADNHSQGQDGGVQMILLPPTTTRRPAGYWRGPIPVASAMQFHHHTAASPNGNQQSIPRQSTRSQWNYKPSPQEEPHHHPTPPPGFSSSKPPSRTLPNVLQNNDYYRPSKTSKAGLHQGKSIPPHCTRKHNGQNPREYSCRANQLPYRNIRASPKTALRGEARKNSRRCNVGAVRKHTPSMEEGWDLLCHLLRRRGCLQQCPP